MLIQGFRATYTAFGGSAIFSYVTNLLTVRLGNYGSAIEEIYLTAGLRDRVRDPWVGFENLFDSFHASLDKLPKVTFYRRLKRVEITFASRRFTSEDDRGWEPKPDLCNRAMQEVTEMLLLLKKRVTAKDDFDLPRFLEDVQQLLAEKIDSAAEWLQIREQASAIEIRAREAKSSWEQLGIDWKQYHPDARTILDDPFFWDCANDIAPHGNDTGADLLEDFQRWNRGHRNVSPLRFLDAELAAWQVVPIDWSVTDENAVSALERDKSIEMTLCNEAAIALAFAVLKLRGQCPPDVLRMARTALQRTAIVIRHSSLEAALKTKWESGIKLMQEKLESVLAAP